MLKNYINIAWRSLLKNKVSSLINIGGLSIGLGIGIIVIIWISHELSYDRFQKNLPNIYLMMTNTEVNGEVNTGRETPPPLADEVLKTMPEIRQTARTSQPGAQLLRVGDKNIYETGIYAEPSLFKIMTFKTLSGNPYDALNQSGSIVITESTAKKLFGNENPVGKLLAHDNKYTRNVGAVIADIPQNSVNEFSVILPFRDFERENSSWIHRWDHFVINTWVLTIGQANRGLLNKKINQLYHRKQNEPISFFTYPLKDMRIFNQFKNGRAQGGKIYGLVLLAIIGFFVLLIACINFMNLTVAKSQKRSLEVGIRKVVGATQWQMIYQFLTEAFILTILAAILGFTIAKIGLPYFSTVTKNEILFDPGNIAVWLALIPLVFLTAIIAGGYPAFFLSRFKAITSLRGDMLIKRGKFSMRKLLVTFQFVVSIFLIITTIVIYKQVDYTKGQPIGYKPKGLLRLTAHGSMAEQFPVLKEQLLQLPGIESVSAGNDNLIQFGGYANGFGWTGKNDDQDFAFALAGVQYDWIKTIGADVVEGRDFSKNYGSDTSACLINEAAARKMGLEKPIIGKKVGDKEIIGIVKDFVYNNPNKLPDPMLLTLGQQAMSNVFVRIQDGVDMKKILYDIGQTVKKQNPYYPFEYHFMSDEYEAKFDELRSTGEMINIISLFAIGISCLGLYGLASFVVEVRTKEIGIRKVLGAGIKQMWWSLSKDFLKPVCIAFVIVVPVAILAMQSLLSNWEKRTALSWWIFALSGLIVLCIALFTVSHQALRAARTNPVKSLAAE
ncbi:FtsX-like permease family protein [Olivibacter jilunii]|uniref:ABC transporter permease n=1 Tax=Olivibacter jilunii TaxID=985016 RepID=UPI003F17C217